MNVKILFTSLLSILIISESIGQNIQTVDSIEDNIALVEDSLINWGKVYDKDAQRYTLDELMAYHNIPGLSIAVIDDYKIEWAKAYGYSNRKQKLPVTTNTAFNAASVSKSINALGIINLAEGGKINLHADINTVLTDWKFPYTRNKTISTYQLLTHTSGIWSHWTSSYNHGAKKPSLIKMLDRKKSPKDKTKPYLYTFADPGMKFQYSNAGVSVSQQILVEVTKMAYEDFMQQTIFDRLEMMNSFYTLNKKDQDYAAGYRTNGKLVSGEYRPVVEYAAAGLWTTPTDLAIFAIELQKAALGRSKIISKEGAELMITPVKMQNPHSGVLNIAAGAILAKKGSHTYFFHSGDGSGYTAMYIGNHLTGQGMAVMLNTENNAIVYALLSRIAQVYDWPDYLFNNGQKIDPIIMSKEIKRSYAGRYSCEEFPLNQLEIRFDEKLIGIISGGEDTYLELLPISEIKFWDEGGRLYSHTTIEFITSENGEVDGLIMSNANQSSTWKRNVQ